MQHICFNIPSIFYPFNCSHSKIAASQLNQYDILVFDFRRAKSNRKEVTKLKSSAVTTLICIPFMNLRLDWSARWTDVDVDVEGAGPVDRLTD